MKNYLKYLVVATFVLGLSSSAFGMNYLQNWNIDTTGAGRSDGAGVIDVWDLVNISGIGYAEIYGTSQANPTGTFTNWGVWQMTNSDYVGETYPDLDGDGTIDVELTGIYQFNGDVTLNGPLDFKGGTLDLYLDDRTNDNYGTISSGGTVLGANDGIHIATFSVIDGHGFVSDTGEITQSMDNININYEATFLKAGYFIDANGNDLSVLLGQKLAFSNTTAVTSAPQDPYKSELYWDYASLNGANQGPDYNPPEAIYMTHNGEVKLGIVPEPTTMILFGFGLLGLVNVSRRKQG